MPDARLGAPWCKKSIGFERLDFGVNGLVFKEADRG